MPDIISTVPSQNNSIFIQESGISLQNQLNIFYRGLLLALATERSSFIADESFHAAFGDTVSTEGATYLPEELHEELVKIDPMFAVYLHADVLLYKGLNDYILSFHAPEYIVATFKVSQGEAAKLLQQMQNEKTWRILGKALSDNLD